MTWDAPVDTTMTVEEKMRKARGLMNAYGLDDWKLGLEKNLFDLGRTDIRDKMIMFSAEFMSVNNWERSRETVLHEIAHALTPEDTGESGHGPLWEAKMRELGVTPRATIDPDEDVEDTNFPFSREQAASEAFGVDRMFHELVSMVTGVDRSRVLGWY